FQRVTPWPTAATSPAISRPGSGEWPGGGGSSPPRSTGSGRWPPAAATLTRIWPAAGLGVGMVFGFRTSGPPGVAISITVIVSGTLAMAPLHWIGICLQRGFADVDGSDKKQGGVTPP